jgi:AraC-like DNA-binding protein
VLYRELQPRAALRGSVDCIWVLEDRPEPGAPAEKILPDGRAELIFDLGSPYRRVNDDALQPRGFAVAQIRRYIEVEPTGPVALLGVRFRPTAFHRLVDLPMHELTDRSVALDDLGVPELPELEEQLHDESTWSGRARLVDDVLARLLPEDAGPTAHAVDLIRETHGRLDLARVAAESGTSTRTLERRFADEVGLPPKLYARQMRLQRILALVGRTPRPSWAEIALASGCFDQAHLVRELRDFTGEPPAAFLRSHHELSDHLTGLAGREEPT